MSVTARPIHARLIRARSGPLATSLAGSGITQALGLVTGTILARGLGPRDRGAFAAMVLWPTLCVTLGDLGLANSFAFFTARRPNAVAVLNRTARRMAGLQSLVLVPICLALSYVGLSAAHASPIAAGLVLALGFVPASLISRYVGAILQGQMQMSALYAVRLSMQVPIAIGLIGAWATHSLRIWTAVAVYWAGMLAMLAVTAFYSRRLASAREAQPASEARPRELLRYGLRSLIGSLYPVETLNVDQLLVALVLNTRDLGYYVTALAFTSLPRLIAYGVGVTALPAVAGAERDRQQEVTIRYLGFSVLLLIPITAGLIAIVPLLVPALFGHAFVAAIAPARLLLVGSLIYGLRRVLGDCLRGLERPGVVSVVELLSLPLMVAAALIGSSHGLLGVSYAIAAAQVLSTCTLILAWRAGGPAQPASLSVESLGELT